MRNTVFYHLIISLLSLSSAWRMLCYDGQDDSMSFVHAIHKRYYLIKRLDGPIKHFMSAYEKQKNAKKNSTIRAHTVLSFNRVWQDCLAYKNIENNEFIRKTVTMLLLLYRDLLQKAFLHDDQVRMLPLKAQLNLLDDLTDVVDHADEVEYNPELANLLAGHHMIADFDQAMLSCNMSDDMSTITTLLDEDGDGSNLLVDNNIRFYHIQRMVRSIFMLSKYKYTIHSFDNVCKDFRDLRIVHCAVQLGREKSLDPLFKVWKNFVSYDYINDQVFIHDFIKLVICVYKNIEINRMTSKKMVMHEVKKNLDDALALYNKIDSLPINELLNLLDDMVNQFDKVSHEYDLRNTDLSWGQWIQQYWWMSPVIVGSLFVPLIKHKELISGVIKLLTQ